MLYIVWEAAASDMPEQEFKAHLMRFIELLRVTEAKNFLVDASAGHFIMLPHIQEWHDRIIVPQYEQMGIRKIAFIYPQEIAEAMSLDQTFDEKRAQKLHARFFGSMDKALEWMSR